MAVNLAPNWWQMSGLTGQSMTKHENEMVRSRGAMVTKAANCVVASFSSLSLRTKGRIPALPRAKFGRLQWERHNWLISPKAGGGLGRGLVESLHIAASRSPRNYGHGLWDDAAWRRRIVEPGTHAVHLQMTHTVSWSRYRGEIAYQIGRKREKSQCKK